MTNVVKIVSKPWSARGHGGEQKIVDYTIFLNDVKLRMFSTHGNMQEGYWGASARMEAAKYALAVAETLGVEVQHERYKEVTTTILVKE